MNNSVFIFLGSKALDNSRQFENHQLGFLENLYANGIIDFKHVIMSVYIPVKIDNENELIIKIKTRRMEDLARKYCFKLDIIYIKGKTFKSLFTALKQVIEKASTFDSKIIFSQNYHSGFIGFRLKQKLGKVYHHANLRGVPAEEELFYSDSFLLRRITNYLVLKWFEKKIIPKVNSVSVVSREYTRYLKQKFRSGINISVYPCAYNTNKFYADNELREIYREKYQIEKHHLVLIYSGSLNRYQLPAKIFQFYENLSKQDIDKNCVFIFLTLDKKVAQNFSKSFNINNLIIESAFGNELLGFYNASDIGMIIRKKDLVNRVASPTKIPEYLATGNSIILTEGIGDFSEELKNKKFALIKKNTSEFLKTKLYELKTLKRPDTEDLNWIKENYSSKKIFIYKEMFHSINSLSNNLKT